LLSAVEHRDENYYHLHFYVVPTLDEGKRLDINKIHPGRYAKAIALAEGADKKDNERSYRKGMREWQGDYYRRVSSFFHHDRYGPRRARVSRREGGAQKRMEEREARFEAELEAKAAEHDRELERRRADSDRECEQLAADVKQGAWQTYAKLYQELRAINEVLRAHLADAEARHSAEIARLRARLAELEPAASMNLVV